MRSRGACDAKIKGHGKPIRRLAMTSILKQNTTCFALPLCSHYRRGFAAVSKGKRPNGPIRQI
jgi:hypothetical protein